MKVLKCLVQRNILEGIETEVPEHEVPILSAVHEGAGPAAVQVMEETSGQYEPASVQLEYARLRTKYGEHPETHVPFVELIYGRLETGNLTRALGVPAYALHVKDTQKPKRQDRAASPAA